LKCERLRFRLSPPSLHSVTAESDREYHRVISRYSEAIRIISR
jgi:hypothetical protein